MTRRAGKAGAWGSILAVLLAVVALPGVQPASGTPAATRSCSADWPQYQQDDHHDAQGCSALNALSTPTLLPKWFVSTKGTVTAEPTVADGTVYVGDSTGAFHALDQGTGATLWTFTVKAQHSCYVDAPDPHSDTHSAGFGAITSSATFTSAVGADPAHPGDPTVYVGGGGSLFALDAVTGACDWAEDIDPGTATDAIEIESSPVVDTALRPPEVIVGSDDNGSSRVNVTGVQAFNASSGALLWRYEPERDVTLYPREFGGSTAMTLSCGDGSFDPNCTPASDARPGAQPKGVG